MPTTADDLLAMIEEGTASSPSPLKHTPEKIRAIINRAAEKYGLPKALFEALVHRESSFDPAAVSPKGAKGLGQLMPLIANKYGVKDPFDPEQNADGSAAFLSDLLKKYKGNTEHALAAYNAGETAVDKHGGIPPYPETQNYVAAILASAGGLPGMTSPSPGPADSLLADFEDITASAAPPEMYMRSPLQQEAHKRSQALKPTPAKAGTWDRVLQGLVTSAGAVAGGNIGATLGALVPPEFSKDFAQLSAQSTESLALDLFDNPGRILTDLFKASPTSDSRELRPDTKRLVDFMSNIVSPEAMFNMAIDFPARMTKELAIVASPFMLEPVVEFGPEGPVMNGPSPIRAKTPEEHLAALNAVWTMTDELFGGPAFRILRDSYGEKGFEGILEAIADNPDLALGAAMPLLLIAGTASAGRVDVNAIIRQAETRRALQAEAAHDLRLAFDAAASERLGHLPDPAINLAVRVLTEAQLDGTFKMRTVDEWLRENGFLAPEGSILPPDKLAQQDAILRLAEVLERETRPFTDPSGNVAHLTSRDLRPAIEITDFPKLNLPPLDTTSRPPFAVDLLNPLERQRVRIGEERGTTELDLPRAPSPSRFAPGSMRPPQAKSRIPLEDTITQLEDAVLESQRRGHPLDPEIADMARNIQANIERAMENGLLPKDPTIAADADILIRASEAADAVIKIIDRNKPKSLPDSTPPPPRPASTGSMSGKVDSSSKPSKAAQRYMDRKASKLGPQPPHRGEVGESAPTDPGFTFVGVQKGIPGKIADFEIYNLTRDIVDPKTGEVSHTAGSTVSRGTLEKAGLIEPKGSQATKEVGQPAAPSKIGPSPKPDKNIVAFRERSRDNPQTGKPGTLREEWRVRRVGDADDAAMRSHFGNDWYRFGQELTEHRYIRDGVDEGWKPHSLEKTREEALRNLTDDDITPVSSALRRLKDARIKRVKEAAAAEETRLADETRRADLAQKRREGEDAFVRLSKSPRYGKLADAWTETVNRLQEEMNADESFRKAAYNDKAFYNAYRAAMESTTVTSKARTIREFLEEVPRMEKRLGRDKKAAKAKIETEASNIETGYEPADAPIDTADFNEGLKQLEKPLPSLDDATTGVGAGIAEAAARRKGVGSSGSAIGELQALGQSKGLSVTLNKDTTITVATPNGVITTTSSPLAARQAIDKYVVKPPPGAPPKGEAGTFRPDTFIAPLRAAYDAMFRRRLKDSKAELREQAEARNWALNIYTRGLTPSRLASQPELSRTPGRETVARGQRGTYAEYTSVGANSIGRLLRGHTEAEAAIVNWTSRMIDPMRMRGVDPSRGPLALVNRFLDQLAEIEGSANDAGIWDIMDSLITSEHRNGKWISTVRHNTEAHRIPARPDADLATILRGRETWNRLSPELRKSVLEARLVYDEIADLAAAAQIKSELFREMNKKIAPPEFSGKISSSYGRPSPKNKDLQKLAAYHEEVPVLSAFRGSGLPNTTALAPAAEQRAAAGPFSRSFSQTPKGQEILRDRLNNGQRISAYISHIVKDAFDVEHALFEEAIELIPDGIAARENLADGLWNAMRANPDNLYRPTSDPKLTFDSPQSALRYLFPGISDARLGEFMAKSAVAIRDSNRWTHKIVQEVPIDIFTAYLRQRVKESGKGGSFVKSTRAYLSAMARKIYVEPAANEALLQIDAVTSPAWRYELRDMITTMSGKRPYYGPAGEAIRRGASKVTAVAANAVLRLNIPVALINLTQQPIFGRAELGLLSPKEVKFAYGLLAQHEFWEWIRPEGFIQEALPYDLVRRAGVNTNFIRMISDGVVELQKAPSIEAAHKIWQGMKDGGMSLTDFMALSEIPNRVTTVARSMAKTANRLGIIDKMKAGKWELTPGEYEAMLNEAAVNVGNVNYFMGRGANRVKWQAEMRQSKLLGPVADPLVMLTSYPQGLQGTILSALRNIATKNPLTQRRGASTLAIMLAGVVLLAGPIAGFGVVVKMIADDLRYGTLTTKPNPEAADKFVAFVDKWEREYCIAGRFLGAEWTNRIGFQSNVPFLQVTGDLLEGRAPNVGDAFMNQIASNVLGDYIQTGVGLARTGLSNQPLTRTETEAINNALGAYGAWFNVEVPQTDDVIPYDVGLMMPAMTGIKRYLLPKTRPTVDEGITAIRDAKGRTEYERTASEDTIAMLYGDPIGTRRRRQEQREAIVRSEQLSNLKQIATRAYVEEDPRTFIRAMQRLRQAFPPGSGYEGFNVTTFMLEDLPKRVERETKLRPLTEAGRRFISAPEEIKSQMLATATKRLNTYLAEVEAKVPLGKRSLVPTEVRKEHMIYQLGQEWQEQLAKKKD